MDIALVPVRFSAGSGTEVDMSPVYSVDTGWILRWYQLDIALVAGGYSADT